MPTIPFLLQSEGEETSYVGETLMKGGHLSSFQQSLSKLKQSLPLLCFEKWDRRAYFPGTCLTSSGQKSRMTK